MVSHSEHGVGDETTRHKVVQILHRHGPDDDPPAELDVRIRVSYRTLAVVFAFFSVVGHIIDSVTRADLSTVSEMLFGWFPF
uniref:Uncharacterized protein n=1 Tax=Leviviridae sp. TaxID=2027243 RepID=A0A514D054_9VIRU|nr:MAG: hypothetical protein H3BulkLitter17443_000003 [Leviviridae sp.]